MLVVVFVVFCFSGNGRNWEEEEFGKSVVRMVCCIVLGRGWCEYVMIVVVVLWE